MYIYKINKYIYIQIFAFGVYVVFTRLQNSSQFMHAITLGNLFSFRLVGMRCDV